MKYEFTIKRINKYNAIEFVQEYHYSKVMPKLTKHFLGVYNDDVIVGVLTLGWGTQPLQTIRKMFPKLTTKDYYEIGKMCMHPDMPRNSESQMLSAVVKWMKENTPDIKFLYTWADGIVGKPGYVYQASNFYYGGFIWTDIYIGPDGEKIHPRSARKLLEENAKQINKDRVFWLTYDFIKQKGIKRIKGKQFRYIIPMSKKMLKYMNSESTLTWNKDYPKHSDLVWKEQTDSGYNTLQSIPNFDLSIVNVNEKNVNSHKSTNTIDKFFI